MNAGRDLHSLLKKDWKYKMNPAYSINIDVSIKMARWTKMTSKFKMMSDSIQLHKSIYSPV